MQPPGLIPPEPNASHCEWTAFIERCSRKVRWWKRDRECFWRRRTASTTLSAIAGISTMFLVQAGHLDVAIVLSGISCGLWLYILFSWVLWKRDNPRPTIEESWLRELDLESRKKGLA